MICPTFVVDSFSVTFGPAQIQSARSLQLLRLPYHVSSDSTILYAYADRQLDSIHPYPVLNRYYICHNTKHLTLNTSNLKPITSAITQLPELCRVSATPAETRQAH
jgi:hypothetical protein